MIEAVFFDVGNTLLYPYPSVSAVCREILLDAGHDHEIEAIDELLPLVDEYYEDRYREDDTFWTDEGETSQVWVGMYSLLVRRLGIDEDAEKLARRVYDEFGDPARWRAYDDVIPTLKRLAVERRLKVGVISNWDSRLEELLNGLGLSAMLDAIVSSADVGLHKPDPRIFQLACTKLGVEPENAVHVGDHHYADIVGASAVGMAPVMIDRYDAERDGAIATLDELDDAVEWGR
jgi:putative hydrolase of the HAD superfamily